MQELVALRKETHAALCLSCGKCSTMCPLSPSGWFSAARMVAIRDADRELAGQIDSLNACLTCGSCEQRCPEGVHFVDFVRGVRALKPGEYQRPCPHGEMLQAAARLMAKPEAPQRDLSWIDDDLRVAQEGETALFVGCLPQLDILFEQEMGVRTIEIARAAIRLLNGLGIEPVVLAEERCCGHDLLWNGEHDAFEALAKGNLETYEARGIQRILTTCGECYRTWALDYPALSDGYSPKVQHLSEFLAEQIDGGRLEARGGDVPKMTYQDPCRLGRHGGVFDAPRQVLETVGNGSFREMELSGSDSVCCGTSGFIHCDAASRRLQDERLASAMETGAETLVTACPKCLVHFSCTQTEDRLRRREPASIRVEDLTVLAARMLGPTAQAGEVANQQTGEAS
jgi:Fe-S oxidoreductase